MRQQQSAAIGGLNWAPSEFWAATPADFYAAIEHHDRVKARREAEDQD